MGTTLHAIVEFRHPDGGLWTTAAQFEFGKDYEASAAVFAECQRGWPDDIDIPARRLKELVEDHQWCEACEVPEFDTEEHLWVAFCEYCDGMWDCDRQTRVLFWRQ